jgi:hypothetical protein
LDPLEKLVLEENLVFQDSLVLKELREIQDIQAKLVPKETRAQKATRVL